MALRRVVYLPALFPVLLFNLAAAQTPPEVAIFDGRTLDGWAGTPGVWRVEDGAITAEIPDGGRLARNEFLYWQGEVGDFELSLEFRLSGHASANSGVQYRSQREADGHAKGYQADIDLGATWLGRIYDEHGRALLVERGTRVSIAPDGRRWVDTFATPESFRAHVRANDWNTYRIEARASHVEIWINDVLFSVLDDHQAGEADLSGLLAVQLHSGPGPVKVQFRNIRLRDLGRTEARTVEAVRPAASATFATIRPKADDGRELNLGFETGGLDDWTAEGDAWAGQPTRVGDAHTRTRRLEAAAEPVGRHWIGPHRNLRETATGRLTSVPFAVTERWASYLIAGGRDINRTRFEILRADTGAVLHSSSGRDSAVGRREVVDLRSVLGERIRLRLVDEGSDAPDSLFFDDFVFHDREPDFATATFEREKRGSESPVLWHLQDNPAPPSPVANVDAQKVVRDLRLMPGFRADLVAAEPDVHQPVAFAIDERGRLWIAEAYSYPTKRPEGEGLDRILILEDTDGDGHFETRKVFAEKLNLVSGLEVGFGGVWVGAAPHLLFIPDRDRDDRPDGPAEVLLDGWGYQDTHETLNSFAWGPDGWLYGVHGVFTTSHVGAPGTPADARTLIRAGVWRFHPVRRTFEVYAHGGSNQWGLDFNALGHAFMTHCRSYWGGGGTTFVIRNGHYWNQANRDYPAYISNRAPDFAPELRNYLPSSARYDSGEGGAGKPGTAAVYGGHSHVGTMIYLGDNWPGIYRDRLFTNNLHGHQLNQQHNVRSGSGYETFHAGFDLLFAPDTTYMAVDLQYGPDGAVYLIDWCDHQHCHTPREDVWERTNGRVYRLAWADTWKPAKVDLGALADAALAALHTHPNEWHVRTARRILQARAAERALDPEAVATLRRQALDTEDVPLRLRACFTLHAAGVLDDAVLAAMRTHPHDAVRGWAVTLATERPEAPRLSFDVLRAMAADDPSPAVRLALASALPALGEAEAWELGAALAGHAADAEDRFLPKMLWFGLAPHADARPGDAFALAAATPLPTLADSIRWYAARRPDGRDRWAARLAELPPSDPAWGREARLLAFALSAERAMPAPARWGEVAARLGELTTGSPEYAAVRELSALFGDKAVLATARAQAVDRESPAAERAAAFALLRRAEDAEATAVYRALLDEAAFRKDAVAALATRGDPGAAEALLEDFPELAAADRTAALATLTERPAYALALLRAVEAGRFPAEALNALHFRQLRNLGNAEVDALTGRLWTGAGETTGEARATIARLRQAYEAAPLWAFSEANGRRTFAELCAACHAVGGEGGRLGPDLTASWRNGLEYFLENTVDPNGVVGTDYQLNLVTKRDGAVVAGMIERETEGVVVVRTVSGTVNVPKHEIAVRETVAQSLMPAGLLEGLEEAKAIELLKYLLSPK